MNMRCFWVMKSAVPALTRESIGRVAIYTSGGGLPGSAGRRNFRGASGPVRLLLNTIAPAGKGWRVEQNQRRWRPPPPPLLVIFLVFIGLAVVIRAKFLILFASSSNFLD